MHSSSGRLFFFRLVELFSVVFCLFMVGGIPSVFATTEVPGRIKGSLSVSASGGALYRIPIDVPPGTAGLEPELSLLYNSQNRYGMMGMGWNLNGISSIIRCPQTLAQDGVSHSIQFNQEDRFCLDGARLVLDTAVYSAEPGGPGGHLKEYGEDWATYRLEKGSWTKVISHGTCGTGPCSFIAYLPDGTQIEYGTTDDSRIEVPGRLDVMVWTAHKIQDAQGNYQRFSYDENLETGEHTPVRIEYTGNDQGNLSPQRSVEFTYETGPERVAYLGGALLKKSQLLKWIKTYVEGHLVLSYYLTYEEEFVTHQQILTQIQKCNTRWDCLTPTVFEWNQQGGLGFEETDSHTYDFGIDNGKYTHLIADINGDGRSDMVRLSTESDQGWVGLGQSDGTFDTWTHTITQGQANDTHHHQIADINGDGRSDLIQFDKEGMHAWIALGQHDGFLNLWDHTTMLSSHPLDPPAADAPPLRLHFFADVNADGRVDLIKFDRQSNQGWVGLGQSDGSIQVWTHTLSFDHDASHYDRYFVDVNGDGRSDLVQMEKDGQTGWIGLAQPDGNFHTWDQTLSFDYNNKGYIHQFADVNGDGFIDFIRYFDINNADENGLTLQTGQNGYGWIGLGKGDGTFEMWTHDLPQIIEDSSVMVFPETTLVKNYFVDVNSDGRSDFLSIFSGGTELPDHDVLLFIRLAERDGSISETKSHRIIGANNKLAHYFVDVDGNGIIDYLQLKVDGDEGSYRFNRNNFQNHIVQITDGLGGGGSFDYKPLTDDSVYTKHDDAIYPEVDKQNSLYVVSEHSIQGGRGEQYRFQHHYEGAKINVLGRGWLGFQNISVKDLQSNLTQVTTYHQTYPLTGKILSHEVLGEFNETLKRTDSLWDATTFMGVAHVLKREENLHHYTDGIFNYTFTRRYSYDEFDNVSMLEDLGILSDSSDDVITCVRYSRDLVAWQLSHPIASKQVNDPTGCYNLETWDPHYDLSFHQFEYDSEYNLIIQRSRLEGVHTSQWVDTHFEYDEFGNTISVTNPLGHQVVRTYDTHFHTFLEHETSNLHADTPLLNKTKYEPTFGNQMSSTDVNDVKTARDYDDFGRLIAVWGPNLNDEVVLLKHYDYFVDEHGLGVTERYRTQWKDDNTDHWAWTTKYQDALGRIYRTQSTGPQLGVEIIQEREFDSQGRLWKESLPYFTGDTPQYTIRDYDQHNHLKRVTLPDGSFEEYTYSLLDLKVTTHRPSPSETYHHPTTVETTQYMNSRGQVIRKVLADGSEIHYTYDRLGRLLSSTDALGGVTSYTYDSLGRLLENHTPERGLTTMIYDEVGQLLSRRDAKGQYIEFTYDAIGRQENVTHRTSDGTIEREIHFIYDDPNLEYSLGRLSRVEMPYADASYEYEYDKSGNVKHQEIHMGGQNYNFHFIHDPLNRIAVMNYPDGSELRHKYTASGHLADVGLKDSRHESHGVKEFAGYRDFNALGQFTSLHYGNGVSTTRDFDEMGRLISSTISGPQGTLMANQYTWNQANKLLQIDDQIVPNHSQTFTYHLSGQLHTASGPYLEKTYEYDPSGNLNRLTQGEETQHYEYDPVKWHQMISAISDEPAAGNQFSFHYDENGNLAQKLSNQSTIDYLYNVDNQLMEVRNESGTIALYEYDAFGRRIRKSESNGNTTHYIAPSFEVTEYHDKTIQTKYVFGATGAIAAVTDIFDATYLIGFMGFSSLFVFGFLFGLPSVRSVAFQVETTDFLKRHPQQKWMIPLLLTIFTFTNIIPSPVVAAATMNPYGPGSPDVGIQYFHQNHILSTALVTDATGAELSRMVYEPFGSIEREQSSGPDDFRAKFTGKEYDHDSAIYYFGSRYYDPTIGRFLTPDPAWQYQSPYVYGFDDPQSGVDPDGEFFFIILAVVVGAYTGASMLNHDPNPAHWNWKSGKTWAGLVGGAAIGAAGGVAGELVAQSGMGMVGTLAAEGTISGMENAAFTAMDGGNFEDIGKSFASGALFGAALGAGTRAMGAGFQAGRKALSRGMTEAAEEAEETSTLAEACYTSFVEGTPVLSESGLKPIESLQVGDRVWTYDEATQQMDLKPIERLYTRVAPDSLEIQFGEQIVETTSNHEFWTDQNQWVAADNLKVGDAVLSFDGGYGRIENIRILEGSTRVFNFEVADNPNYFVSQEEVLAHNCRPLQTRAGSKRAARGDVSHHNIVDGSRIKKGVIRYADGSTDEFYTLRPGGHADASIKARSTAQHFTAREKQSISRIGKKTGCHSCGRRKSGYPNPNHFTPDHQPVSGLYRAVHGRAPIRQRLYPHCKLCSRHQGRVTAKAIRIFKKTGAIPKGAVGI